MSNKNKKTAKKTEKAKEQKFLLHDLRSHCQELFGVKPEVFDGAFFNEKELKVTKQYAEKRIKTFLNKEVK